jgi:hypothetical protein
MPSILFSTFLLRKKPWLTLSKGAIRPPALLGHGAPGG